MTADFISNYVNIVILGICVCVGYIIKNGIPSDKINRFIPLIAGGLGVCLAAWAGRGISPDIILTGLVSGLASTGLYEALKGAIFKK